MGLGGSKTSETGDSETGLDSTFLESLNLSPDVKTKIEEQYVRFKSQYDELKSKYERLRVDAEQRQFEFEKRLESSSSQWESASSDAKNLRAQVSQLEQKYNEAKRQIHEMEVKQTQADDILRELESERCTLEVDKTELAGAVERKDHEIDRLNEEWKQMSARLAEAKSGQTEALIKVEEVETQSVTAQHREQRFAQENGHLQQQNAWLEQEIKEKMNELLTLRKEQSERHLELEAQLDLRNEENRRLEEITERLKDSVEEQNRKIENYCEKLREARDAQVQQEELHSNQLHSQTKLINLYKAAASEGEEKIKELTSAVSELQKLLKDASQANTELETTITDEENQHKEAMEEKDAHIERIQKELEHANELIEAARKKGTIHLSETGIEAMSPSAAAASRLLKSGMTLTQIYSEYVQTSEGLLMEKEENQRLNQYLDQILQEIEERAPVLKKQREDYEKAVGSINELTGKLDVSMLDCEKVRVASDDSLRRCSHLSRENHRLKQQTSDLGQQVRMLLKELEEARGTVVTTDAFDEDVSVAEVSSSSQVISQRLVSFRSIKELQEQNQRLLEAIRDLSEKKEQEEKLALDSSTAELKQELDTVSEELQIMKSQRDRQAGMVESIVRQRDMYRVLLAQVNTTPLPAPSPVLPHTSTPMPAAKTQSPDVSHMASQLDTSQQMQETKEALNEMQQEFNLYRTEKATNEKIMTEQLEKFRQDASDLRLQNARLASQLDFAGERNKILKSNTDSFKKEISALRDKNAQYSASVIRHEQTINTLKQDLMGVQEKLLRSEVVGENLRSERNMLKSVEARLLMEKESMMREQSTQKLLLANLQTIQNNLERSDFEKNTQFTQRIEMLEKENAGLKRKLDGIDSQHRSFMKTLENRIVESQAQYDKEKLNHQVTKKKLDNLQEEVTTLQQKHSEVTSQLQKAQEKLTSDTSQSENMDESNVMEEEIKDLKMRLSTANTELKGLKAQLEQAKQHATQYKAIADSIEHNLQEQSETSKQFKEATETQLNEAKEAKERYERQLEQVEKERQNLINENFRITEKCHKTNAELQKQLQVVQSELEEAVQQRKLSASNEQAARADHSVQAQLAQEAQDKYERELILHAADVEALTTVKQQLAEFNKKMAVVEDEARTVTAKLESTKMSWADQERMYKEEEKNLKTRISDVQNQNKLLHEQMQALSVQMMTLQQKQEQENQQGAALAESVKTDEENRSTDQLLEVIRFLRKEKEIAEAKGEVAQAESTRLHQRVSYAERQLEEAKTSLAEERENVQVNALGAAQQVELMRKVENLNILQDSNRMLREDRDRLSNQLQEAENRSSKLQEEIRPLQASQHELISVRDALAAEKTSLLAEVERWRARTNQLIEQCNKTDPEEHKKLIQERETLRKQVAAVTEESHKQRAEISRLNVALAAVQEELASRKAELQKLTVENGQMKTSIEAKDKDSDEKMKTINQLRKIGRKYRMQAEEAQKNLETLKEELEKGSGGKIASLEEKLKTSERDLELITEKLGSSVVEKNEALQLAKESENTVKGLREQLGKSNEELKKHKDIEGTQETNIKELQEQISKLTEEVKKHKEAEGKHIQARNMVTSARAKLISQKEIIEKITAENTELKQKLSTLEHNAEEATAQRAAYESRVVTLERDLETMRNSQSGPQSNAQRDLEKLQQDYNELQQRLLAMQKLLGSQQKTPQQPGTAKPTVSAPPVERTGAGPEPRTANIRPMATSTAQSRSVQPVRSTTADRAMASIRPMAVAPTPTATVMPTTVSVPEGEMASPTVSASGVRPTPPIQPVSPHVESETQVSAEMSELETIEVLPVNEPTPSTSTGRDGQGAPPGGKRTREETEGSEGEQDSCPIKRTKTQEPEAVIELTLASQDEAPQQAVVEVMLDIMSEAAAAASTVAPPEVVPEQQLQEEASSKEVGVVEPAMTQTTIPSSSQVTPQVSLKLVVETERPETSTSGDIIVVDDDDEDEEEEGEVEEDQDEDYEEEEDEDYVDEEGEEEEMEGYEEGDEGEGDEEEEGEEEDEEEGYDMQGEEYTEEGEVREEDYSEEGVTEDVRDPDEVVIVEDDDDDEVSTPMESQDESRQLSTEPPSGGVLGSSQAPQAPPRVQLGRIPPRTERLQAARPAQQLPPFIMSSQQTPFEEGDDSIVPSTPTLFVPKGTDGFQVAVSSPQVPQGRFVFGAGSSENPPSQSGLAQLESQGAFGMDDTRMDLSQFDDGTGRSGATTPRSRTPPTIAITEAPPQETETQSTDPEVRQERSAATTESSSQGQDVVVVESDPISEVSEAASKVEETSDSSSAAVTQQEGRSTEEGQIVGESGTEDVETTESTETAEEKSSPGEEKPDSGQAHMIRAIDYVIRYRPQPMSRSSRVKKIQRIVWDQPGTSGSGPSAAAPAQQPQQSQQPQQQQPAQQQHHHPQQPQRRFGRGGQQQQPHRSGRPQTAFRGHPIQRLGGSQGGPVYPHQAQGMMRGNVNMNRGSRGSRGGRGQRRGRPF